MTIARQKHPDRRIDIAVKDAKRVLDPSVREADHAESDEVLSHQDDPDAWACKAILEVVEVMS